MWMVPLSNCSYSKINIKELPEHSIFQEIEYSMTIKYFLNQM